MSKGPSPQSGDFFRVLAKLGPSGGIIRGMAHVLSGRAETPTQSRILSYVRDEGPLSRMDLASRLNVSRTTVAAEVGRLVELGLAVDGGPAASRGGRRSTLVDLDAGLRFVGI